MVAGAKRCFEAAQAGGCAGTTAGGRKDREDNGVQWGDLDLEPGAKQHYVMRIEGKLSRMYT